MSPVVEEELASQVLRALAANTEAASRLQAAETLDDIAERSAALIPLAEDFRLRSYTLGNMIQVAREMDIAALEDKPSLISAACQLAVSLNTAGCAAAAVAASDQPIEVRAPSQMVVDQEELDAQFSAPVRAWLLEKATKDSRRDLKALRASLSLSEF